MKGRVVGTLQRGPRVLTAANVPKTIQRAQYAVRGELVLKALQYEKILATNPDSLKFKRITYCNIGNPQQLGQPPLTFFRQVIALVEYPELLDKAANIFPEDARIRARQILEQVGATGAYTHSQGIEYVRKAVANFIERRDGMPENSGYADPDNIFLSDGASPAVQQSLRVAIRGENDGILIPIPQYPLYSATIPLLGGEAVPYYLDESSGWSLSIDELRRAVTQSRARGIEPRAIVVINPGNPTGACLNRENIEDILHFSAEEGLLVFADEVYQENVYVKETKPFISFKRVLHDMGPEYSGLELLSFHSISKGFLGECGKRGGYVEMVNIDQEVKQEFYKLASINLCPNVIGQLMLSMMVDPPRPGDASWEVYRSERDAIYDSLKSRAQFVVNQMNALPGIECQPAEGAMYAFPTIKLPTKAVAAAQKINKSPDTFYCLNLLEETGLCVVPGSGFGQREGTFHFRTTFLPREQHLREVMTEFAKFHLDFLKKYE